MPITILKGAFSMSAKFMSVSLLVGLAALQSCKSADASKSKEVVVANPVQTCQTAAEIDEHQKNVDHKPFDFCIHKITNPSVGLVSNKPILADKQLKSGLEVAFSNHPMGFSEAQEACHPLGADWHTPASNSPRAVPQSADNSNSIESLGEYFRGASRDWFWSSSTVPSITSSGWYVSLENGYTFHNYKYDNLSVVCVKP